MASDSQPTSYAWAIYYDSRGQPNRTSTISFPSGFALASTEAGGKIVFTNTASITSTTFDPGLTVQYPPVVQPPLPPTAQPTNSEINTISATSMPLSSSSTLTSTPLSSQHAESTSPSSQSNTPSPSRSGKPLPSDHRLPNGTVAGIVIGVALGLVLLTFLAIYLVMRHKRSSGGKSRYQDSKGSGTSGPGSADQRSRSSEPKGPLVTELPDSSGALETHLPQSADDQTVQNSAKTTLDQIELHVENFYQGVARSSSQSAEADVATFNSPYLSNSLGTLLQQSSNAVPLIKHALAHFITDSISLIANPESTLLPEEFVLLPSTVKGANASGSAKPGESLEIVHCVGG